LGIHAAEILRVLSTGFSNPTHVIVIWYHIGGQQAGIKGVECFYSHLLENFEDVGQFGLIWTGRASSLRCGKYENARIVGGEACPRLKRRTWLCMTVD